MVDILSTLNKGGSGLDLKSLTTSLVAAEFQPKIKTIEKSISKTEASISGIGQIRAQMGKLAVATSAIAQTPAIEVRSSNAPAEIKVTDYNAIKETSSDVYVDALATRQVIEFKGFTSPAAVVGAGSLTVEIGGWTDIDTDTFVADPQKMPQTISVLEGDTLEQIAAKLGELEGVTARVLDKGDGTFSLGIVSEVGWASGIRIGATVNAETPGLSILDMTSGAAEHQVQAGADAVLEVDGFLVSRPSNEIDDLIPGTVLTLKEVGHTNISVERNAETAAENLKFLVESINETLALLSSLTSRGADGNERGALAGDLAVETVAATVRSVMAAPIRGYRDGGVTLGELGIATRRDGSFAFDRATFDAAFKANPELLNAAFTDRLETNTMSARVSGDVAAEVQFGEFQFARPGGTGQATISGQPAFEIPLGGGRSEFVTFFGPYKGLTLTVEDGVESASVNHARSFLSVLNETIDSLLSGSSQIAKREAQLDTALGEAMERISVLDDKALSVEERYMEKFMAMELAITQLNSTGEYLTNLIDSWNNTKD